MRFGALPARESENLEKRVAFSRSLFKNLAFFKWFGDYYGETKHWSWLITNLLSRWWSLAPSGVIVTPYQCSMLEFTQHAYSLRTRILFLVFLAFFVSTGKTPLVLVTIISRWFGIWVLCLVQKSRHWFLPFPCFYFQPGRTHRYSFERVHGRAIDQKQEVIQFPKVWQRFWAGTVCGFLLQRWHMRAGNFFARISLLWCVVRRTRTLS